MNNTIFFDEAGNTGQDLLNKDQKVFVLSSVNFTKSQSDELSKIFDLDNEIHFKNLKNSSKGREKIIQFLNHELINEQNIIISFNHKKFIAVSQIVDQLIEPILYNKGIDLYKDGRNIIYSNFMYYFGECIWNNDDFNKLLIAFIKMIREKNDSSIKDFYNITTEFSKKINKKQSELLFTPILESKKEIESILENATKYTIDVTLSTFLCLCTLWYKQTQNKFDVIFDNSKQIEHYKEYIDYVANLNVDTQEVGYGTKTMIFPTQINNLTLEDSKSQINLQFADLIASSIAFKFNNTNRKQQKFVDEINKSKLINLTNCHSVWPEPNFTPESINMQNSKGNNILDFLVNQAT